MEPTLKTGQYVLGKLNSAIKKDDLAIIGHADEILLKRIKAMNNDSIYLAGDNPNDSLDSRDFGWLPKSVIIAKAIWY